MLLFSTRMEKPIRCWLTNRGRRSCESGKSHGAGRDTHASKPTKRGAASFVTVLVGQVWASPPWAPQTSHIRTYSSLPRSPDFSSTNAHASKRTKRGAADPVAPDKNKSPGRGVSTETRAGCSGLDERRGDVRRSGLGQNCRGGFTHPHKGRRLGSGAGSRYGTAISITTSYFFCPYLFCTLRMQEATIFTSPPTTGSVRSGIRPARSSQSGSRSSSSS